MKTFLCLLSLLLPVCAWSQPIKRQYYTTNANPSLSVAGSNAVVNIAVTVGSTNRIPATNVFSGGVLAQSVFSTNVPYIADGVLFENSPGAIPRWDTGGNWYSTLSGAGLTSLNASALASGAVPSDRLGAGGQAGDVVGWNGATTYWVSPTNLSGTASNVIDVAAGTLVTVDTNSSTLRTVNAVNQTNAAGILAIVNPTIEAAVLANTNLMSTVSIYTSNTTTRLRLVGTNGHAITALSFDPRAVSLVTSNFNGSGMYSNVTTINSGNYPTVLNGVARIRGGTDETGYQAVNFDEGDVNFVDIDMGIWGTNSGFYFANSDAGAYSAIHPDASGGFRLVSIINNVHTIGDPTIIFGTNGINLRYGTYVGDGSTLTDLNGTNITDGTISSNKLNFAIGSGGSTFNPTNAAFTNPTNIYTANAGANIMTVAATVLENGTDPGLAFNGQGMNFLVHWDTGYGVYSPLFTGSGNGLTNIPRTGVAGLEEALDYLTNNIGGGAGFNPGAPTNYLAWDVVATNFNGNGNNLTNLKASAISGTLDGVAVTNAPYIHIDGNIVAGNNTNASPPYITNNIFGWGVNGAPSQYYDMTFAYSARATVFYATSYSQVGGTYLTGPSSGVLAIGIAGAPGVRLMFQGNIANSGTNAGFAHQPGYVPTIVINNNTGGPANCAASSFLATTITATNGFIFGATGTNTLSDSGSILNNVGVTNGIITATGGAVLGPTTISSNAASANLGLTVNGDQTVNGNVLAVRGLPNKPSYAYGAEPTSGLYQRAAGLNGFQSGGANVFEVGGGTLNGIRIPSANKLMWSSGADAGGTPDTALARNAAGVVRIDNSLVLPGYVAPTNGFFVPTNTMGTQIINCLMPDATTNCTADIAFAGFSNIQGGLHNQVIRHLIPDGTHTITFPAGCKTSFGGTIITTNGVQTDILVTIQPAVFTNIARLDYN